MGVAFAASEPATKLASLGRNRNSVFFRGAASNDVNILVCIGGRQRSESEFRVLYERSGFKLTRIIPTQALSLIEGAPA